MSNQNNTIQDYGFNITYPNYNTNTNTNINNGNLNINMEYNPYYNTEIIKFIGITEKLSNMLTSKFIEIKDNCIHFIVIINNKEVEPIDEVLLMIMRKDIFNIEISRYGYIILIKNARFIKIKNLIETSAKEYIQVEFVYDGMEYNNTLKNDFEKRKEKIELLKQKINIK